MRQHLAPLGVAVLLVAVAPRDAAGRRPLRGQVLISIAAEEGVTEDTRGRVEAAVVDVWRSAAGNAVRLADVRSQQRLLQVSLARCGRALPCLERVATKLRLRTVVSGRLSGAGPDARLVLLIASPAGPDTELLLTPQPPGVDIALEPLAAWIGTPAPGSPTTPTPTDTQGPDLLPELALEALPPPPIADPPSTAATTQAAEPPQAAPTLLAPAIVESPALVALPDERPATEPGGSSWQFYAGLAGAATGIAAFGTGVSIGLSAKSRREEITPGTHTQIEAQRALRRAESSATLANILLVVGGTFLASGAGFWAWDALESP